MPCPVERTVTLTLGNDKSRVPEVVQTLIAECDRFNLISEDDHFSVAVSLEEALINAVVHGNLEVSSTLRETDDEEYERVIASRREHPTYRHRQVTVECSINSERARFEITDEGAGFDVSTIADPTDPDYLERPCGRGLLLMRAFMDEVSYNSTGNSVTLTKLKTSHTAKQESGTTGTTQGNEQSAQTCTA